MALDLPYELHALICSHFDAPTLETYSLICRQVHSFAQQFIFSNIKLVFPRLTIFENSRTESLLRLIDSSPQICDAVRTVSLTHKYVQPFKLRTFYLWDDPILVSLLFRFKNVNKFSMEGRIINFLGWGSISATVQEALTGVFHSTDLTILSLFHVIELPLDVLDGCIALQELSLELVTFNMGDMKLFLTNAWKPLTPRARRTQLNSLRLALDNHYFIFFSMWITSSVCSLDVMNLRRFSVSLAEEYTDHKTLKVILQACAKTLEIFCLNPSFQWDNDEGIPINPVDISIFSSLRVLRLQLTPSGRGSYSRQSYFPWIFDFLSQLPPASSVAEISIKVCLVNERRMSGTQGAIDMAAWFPLDALLASHASNSLRRFGFIALEDYCAQSDDTKAEIRRRFPRLDEANILTVEVANELPAFFSGPEDEDILARANVC